MCENAGMPASDVELDALVTSPASCHPTHQPQTRIISLPQDLSSSDDEDKSLLIEEVPSACPSFLAHTTQNDKRADTPDGTGNSANATRQ